MSSGERVPWDFILWGKLGEGGASLCPSLASGTIWFTSYTRQGMQGKTKIGLVAQRLAVPWRRSFQQAPPPGTASAANPPCPRSHPSEGSPYPGINTHKDTAISAMSAQQEKTLMGHFVLEPPCLPPSQWGCYQVYITAQRLLRYTGMDLGCSLINTLLAELPSESLISPVTGV